MNTGNYINWDIFVYETSKGSLERQVQMIHPRPVTRSGETWPAFCPKLLSLSLSVHGKRVGTWGGAWAEMD